MHIRSQASCAPGDLVPLEFEAHFACMTRTKSNNFIKAWRKHRGLTLERLADRVGVTHSTLSRVERGLQPYNQIMLEALAHALNCDVPDLLIRDPGDPEGIWSIWDNLTPAQRVQAVRVIKALADRAA